MSPVFAHGSLRLYLLSLLASSPRHGYELIQALSERFGGTYSPSAGTIYPRLAKLEEEGLVTRTTQGRKSVYAITEAGRAELAAREDELDAIEDEVTDSVRRLADEVRAGVNEAMRSLRAELASAARDAQRGRARPSSATSAAPRADYRADARLALRDGDAALTEFRQQLRTDLRTAFSAGTLTDAAVSRLRTELAQLRANVLSALDETPPK